MNKSKTHLIILLGTLSILNVIIFSYNNVLGAITIIISLLAFLKVYNSDSQTTKDHIEELETLDRYFDDITRNAVFSLPFPISILSDEGSILWYNTEFKNLFAYKDIKDLHIGEVVEGLKVDHMLEAGRGVIETRQDDKSYAYYYNVVDTYDQNDRNLIVVYGMDKTEFDNLRLAKERDKLVVMVVEVDNYEEIRANTDETVRPMVLGEIDKTINTFASDYKGFARKYENDKYIMIFDRLGYEKMKLDNFPLVEGLEKLESTSSIGATISAGVGTSDDAPLEIYKIARLALDVAQGRGGDQIVENDGENLKYYGGKKGAVDKRTKVKSRIIANATVQLIDQLGDVYIMGHKNPDMDSFGSCLGMYSLAKSRKAEAKIVLKEVTPQISSLFDQAIHSIDGLKDDIITPAEAADYVNENSLIILLDNHSRFSAEGEDLLGLSKNLILIDHHRRGEGYVEAPTLTYLEPYASSTSELVTEIIQYTDNIDLPKVTAEGLLAGIKVDTKSFTYQTGVRTFEAASYLKREGADAINVNRLFNEPAEVVRSVAEVVANTEVYDGVTAISRYDEVTDSSILIAAKAADRMLEIKDVKASFVLTKTKDCIHISGRSSGTVSVQIILERLGGGGHQTAAACQLKDYTIDMAIEKLKKEIDNYLQEEI